VLTGTFLIQTCKITILKNKRENGLSVKLNDAIEK